MEQLANENENLNKIIYPKGGSLRLGSQSTSGALKIKLPVTADISHHRLKFRIEVNNSRNNESTTYWIKGTYLSNTTQKWYHHSAQVLTSKQDRALPVHFGNDENHPIIWIGNENTPWLKSTFIVSEVMLPGEVEDWIEGWELSIDQNFDPVQEAKQTISNVLPLSQASLIWQKSGSDRIYFNGGKVGIGLEDPGNYHLAVNGDMKARKVKATMADSEWPDYVFTPGYPLTDLQVLEEQIQKLHHLPGIPSAAQVKREGIFLDEMAAKLLEKVEELTLHLIEQNKMLKKQEARIKQLESQQKKSRIK